MTRENIKQIKELEKLLKNLKTELKPKLKKCNFEIEENTIRQIKLIRTTEQKTQRQLINEILTLGLKRYENTK